MTLLSRLRPLAWMCACLLVLAALLSYPVAEIGINDDFSYIRSAQLMAQTGHIHYVGWASAMLGWMIPLGALFAKLFGFSFTAIRAAGLLVAAGTAALLQRCFVRSGLSERNATFATLTLVLSPLYLPLATTYMTDIPGMAVTLLCYYGCLRALATADVRRSLVWLVFACIVNAVGGTARQTAWFGVMLMVPSTAWLLRRRFSAGGWLVLGGAWVASLGFIYASLRWFSHQPYSLGEALVAGYIDRDLVYAFFGHSFRALLALGFFLLPVLVAFLPRVPLNEPKARRWVLYLSAFCLACVLGLLAFHQLSAWFAPFDGNYVSERGLIDIREVGVRPVVLRPWLTAPLALLTVASMIAAAGVAIAHAEPDREPLTTRAGAPGWRDLAMILGPATLAYLALLCHRAIFDYIFDRYLLTLLFIAALGLGRLYQERVAPRLPKLSVALLALWAIFAIASNHDLFALERARLAATNELLQAGIGRNRFFGGWEYDGWTQLERYGWINSGSMNTPQGFTRKAPIQIYPNGKPCQYSWARLFPAIRPEFAVSYDNVACSGPSDLPPVAWNAWLPPEGGAHLYIQRIAEPF